jgi:hypothetical protein
MLIDMLAYALIAAYAGIAILGHVLLFQALFPAADKKPAARTQSNTDRILAR